MFSKNTWLNKSALIIVKYSFGFFIFLFATANIIFTYQGTNGSGETILYYIGVTIPFIIALCGIIAAIFFLNKNKISNKTLLICFVISVIVLGLYWIFSNYDDLVLYDDAYNCFVTAQAVLEGDYAYIGFKSYVNTYPHNLPLITYFMIIIKIFNDNALTAIRLINLIFVVWGYLSLYKITDLLFNNKNTNRIMIVLMFLSMQFVFMAFIVYSNAISYALCIVSIMYFIKYFKEDKIKHLVISMILVVISCIIKNNSLIVLVGELIYLILHIIEKRKYTIILIMISTLMVGGLVSGGITKFWEARGDTSYSNKLPMISWIAYGVNIDPNSPGGYFPQLENFHYENDYVVEYTEQEAMYYINYSLDYFKENPWHTVQFYGQKFLRTFANPSYDAFSSHDIIPKLKINESIKDGQINMVIRNIWDAASTVISFGLLFYIARRFKRITLLELICGVIVFGGFLFHMVWETKSLYVYQYFLFLLPYAAYGINMLVNREEGEV